MNKKQKIIVSVVGITIVLLALLGLTYAYFLTRIQGNTNEKSISVTTADLKLVYDDGSDGVVGGENLLPSDTVYTKTFTVKNEGNANVEYGVYLIDVINTFERLDDVKYTLNCTTDGTITCNEVTTETTFPNGISQLITNEIEPGKTHTYTFKFTYKDTNTDQSVDMGKVLQAKLQIFGKNSNGEFMPYEETSLSYAIINNAKLGKNGTTFSATPLTTPAQAITGYKYYTNKVDIDNEKSSDVYVPTTYQEYYWTYGTGYTIDESTGMFTLTGVATCKYNDGTCNTTLIGKYLISQGASNNSSSSDTIVKTTDAKNIYLVTNAPASSTGFILINTNKISSIAYSAEKILTIAEDDYGTSYYYRGGVKDNYIEFNNMCWRIVRVEGDGSTKIILAKEGLCSTIISSDINSAKINGSEEYGYKTVNGIEHPNYETFNGGIYSTLKAWYTSSGLENKKELLKNEKWCLGGSDNYRYNKDTGALLTDAEVTEVENNHGTYYYAAGKRLNGISVEKNATLKCSSEEDSVSDYIGTITADEVVYAGGDTSNSNKFYYLYDNAQYGYLTLSYAMFNDIVYVFAFSVNSDGYLTNKGIVMPGIVRPAVTLATGTKISSGDGTISNPYKILEN